MDKLAFLKNEKGSINYLKKRKIYQILSMALLLASAVAVFYYGLYVSNGTRANLFTVIAILFVIPIGRIVASFVAMMKYSQSDKELLERLGQHVKQGDEVYYDAVFTSKDSVMHLMLLVFTGNQIIGFSSSDKDDVKQINDYYTNKMSTCGLNFSVCITDNEALFLRHLDNGLRPTEEEWKNKDRVYLSDVIRASII